MSTTTEEKTILKKEKSNYVKEISSLKKAMNDYKVERKANWKTFKTKMNNDIDKIEKSVGRLSKNKKNKSQ
ncbi:MAG: hypothetical protein ABIZ51_07685 [Bacteroidia bacterium]